jgi:hypothetical protein
MHPRNPAVPAGALRLGRWRAGAARAHWWAAGIVWPLLLLPAGCGTDADFDDAARANTTVAWDDYLRAHPDGPHAREARARLAALLEDREWQRAHAADTADAYQRYLRGYPQGAHAHDALVAIANLNLAATPLNDVPAEPPPPRPAAGAITRAPAPASVAAAGAPAPAAGATSAQKPVAANGVPPRADAAPAPPPSQRPAVHGGVRVQLGAFTGGSAAAERAWRNLTARYPELSGRTPLIAAARAVDGRAIYRLQLAGLDRAAAEALCRRLAARSDPCVLVPALQTPAKPPR